ncbi:MAG TPA: glycoside hydrolase family 13 protein [Saprospiraceae bacterium]|nr:glycoside hydrolase family 13 protein [Saprospiraceae bacterium]
MNRHICIIFLFLTSQLSFLSGQTSANTQIRLNPTNWWIGMKWDQVQLLVYLPKDGFNTNEVSVTYPGVKLRKVHRLQNSHYFALDIYISPQTKPGKVQIKIGTNNLFWPLINKNQTENGVTYAQGVYSEDFMYLLMPDRFANGDTSNDWVEGMRDQSLRRDTVFNRHGGDLQGVINHLDYLKSLGVTALWLNPVLENDMPTRTEHGYAITDHYRVDPRLGSNNLYRQLVKVAHSKGMKIIQDAIYNHVGLYHWFIQDKPSPDWVHQWPAYQNTSYKDQVLFDPYADSTDKKIMVDGWFTPQMPDLNQANPYVCNFLIQHALWCVEEFGIDGWRVDTYAYNDLLFMNRLNTALMDEYPRISIFGETWVHGVINQSYFTENKFDIPFKSNMPGVTDFQTLWGITDAMTKPFGWTDGVNRLYTTLSQDFVYKQPLNNVIFLSNHDLSRAYSIYGENMQKMKSALCWLLTCRGIPQLYYGEEIGMKGLTSPSDGYVRQDFPGGWQGDKQNKFTRADRTPDENDLWDLISRLATYRQHSKALSIGKLTQYVPEDGVYVYFRTYGAERIMVIMNTNDVSKQVKLARFIDLIGARNSFLELVSGEKTDIGSEVPLAAWETKVYSLE